MVGALVSSGIGLAGSLLGGLKASRQRKRMNRYLDTQDTENKAWYNANALGDYTQRSDTQNLMRNLRENLSRQNRTTANMATVTGATPESQAVQKELSNKVISDTYAEIGAQGQQYKDRVTSQYLNQKSNIANQRMGMMEGQAQSGEGLLGSGLNLLSGAASGLAGSLLSGKGGNNAPTADLVMKKIQPIPAQVHL